MGKITWIWIIIFVVLPILQKIMEAKKEQGQNQVKRRAIDRKKARRQTQRAEEFLGEKVDPGWVQVQTEPKVAEPIEKVELGGGWVNIGEPKAAPASSSTRPPSPLPIGIPQSEGGGGPIRVLTEQLSELGFEVPESVDDPYLIDRDAHDGIHEHAHAGEIGNRLIQESLKSPPPGASRASQNDHQSRWRLNRNQLRNRLIWAEILGPPVSLKDVTKRSPFSSIR